MHVHDRHMTQNYVWFVNCAISRVETFWKCCLVPSLPSNGRDIKLGTYRQTDTCFDILSFMHICQFLVTSVDCTISRLETFWKCCLVPSLPSNRKDTKVIVCRTDGHVLRYSIFHTCGVSFVSHLWIVRFSVTSVNCAISRVETFWKCCLVPSLPSNWRDTKVIVWRQTDTCFDILSFMHIISVLCLICRLRDSSSGSWTAP